MKVWTSLEDERNKVPAWIVEQYAAEQRVRNACAEQLRQAAGQYVLGLLTTGEYVVQVNRIYALAVQG